MSMRKTTAAARGSADPSTGGSGAKTIERWHSAVQAWRNATPSLCYSNPHFWVVPIDATERRLAGWIEHRSYANPVACAQYPDDELASDDDGASVRGWIVQRYWQHSPFRDASVALAEAAADLAVAVEAAGIDSTPLQQVQQLLRDGMHAIANDARLPPDTAQEVREKQRGQGRQVPDVFFVVRDRLLPTIKLLVGRLGAVQAAQAAAPREGRPKTNLDDRACALLQAWRNDPEKAGGFTLQSLADALETSPASLIGKMRGKRRCPTFYDLWQTIKQAESEERMRKRRQHEVPRARPKRAE